MKAAEAEAKKIEAQRQMRLCMVVTMVEDVTDMIGARHIKGTQADQRALDLVVKWAGKCAESLPQKKQTEAATARAVRLVTPLMAIKHERWRHAAAWTLPDYAAYLRAVTWLAWLALDDDSSRAWKYLTSTLDTLTRRFEASIKDTIDGFEVAGEMADVIWSGEIRRAA